MRSTPASVLAVLPHLDGVENGRDGLGEVFAGALQNRRPGAPLSLALENRARFAIHLKAHAQVKISPLVFNPRKLSPLG